MASKKEAIYYELLVLRCQRKDKEALEELIHLFEKRLFYYIKRLVEGEEESWNILQETWLKVINSIKDLRAPANLPSWLYSIARRTSMSYLRSKYSKEMLVDCTEDTSNLEGNAEDFNFDNVEQVHYGLGKISLLHREVLTLFFLEDLSLEETTRVLGISLGTVKPRLHYAKRALKAVLEKEGNI